jgi:hypothetical protein
VRYRVGQTKGHVAKDAPVLTAIDRGTAFITNHRIILKGGKQTRECPFARLIGFHHSVAEGTTTFSLSNRPQPVTIKYGAGHSMGFQ